MKKAYGIYVERGYRPRLLSAAFRNHLHGSEFVGGDVVLSPPFKWQERFNGSDLRLTDRMSVPVPQSIVDELSARFVDFRRAYDEKGMSSEEFDSFGPTVRTLRQFSQGAVDLAKLIRDIMLPNPDL
jgi:transaldolase